MVITATERILPAWSSHQWHYPRRMVLPRLSLQSPRHLVTRRMQRLTTVRLASSDYGPREGHAVIRREHTRSSKRGARLNVVTPSHRYATRHGWEGSRVTFTSYATYTWCLAITVPLSAACRYMPPPIDAIYADYACRRYYATP